MRFLLVLFLPLFLFSSPYGTVPPADQCPTYAPHLVLERTNVWDATDVSGKPTPRDIGCSGDTVVRCSWATPPADGQYYGDIWYDEYKCKTCVEGTEYVPQTYSCESPCDANLTRNPDTGQCEQPPVSCPDGADYNVTAEECQCKKGYDSSYNAGGDLVCTPPLCPDTYDSLPLFKVADSVVDCNFFELSDGSALTRPDGKICCYGQPALDDNSSCPPNNVEINGECYPITDSNKTDPKDCPSGEWWDISANDWAGGCVPIFEPPADSNSTDPNNPPGGSNTPTGGSGELNGSAPATTLTNGDLFGGEMTPDEYSDSLKGYTNKAYDYVKKLLDGYVLVKLPVNISGSCSNELVQTFTILGKSYTVNLTSWFQKINDYNSLIYALVMFIFGVTGVIIVASGRSE